MHPSIRASAAALLCVAATAAVTACSDPNALPDAQLRNIVDTVTISALTGTSIPLPSAYSVADRQPVRTDLSESFDFAFDLLPASGAPVFLPRAALGFPPSGALQPGLQETDEAFDAIEEAVSNGYITGDTIPIAVGERYYARSRIVCASLGVPKYGKLEVLTVDPTARSVTFRILVGDNCGYIGLQPGIPED